MTNFQSASCAQVTSSAEVYEINSEIEHVNAQSTALQKMLDLLKKLKN